MRSDVRYDDSRCDGVSVSSDQGALVISCDWTELGIADHVADLHAIVQRWFDVGVSSLILDLQSVRHADSAAMAVLLLGLARAARTGRSFQIRLSSPLHEVADVLHIASLLEEGIGAT